MGNTPRGQHLRQVLVASRAMLGVKAVAHSFAQVCVRARSEEGMGHPQYSLNTNGPAGTCLWPCAELGAQWDCCKPLL